MSLRLLFLLMGLVTTLMIAGVVYTKVLVPPEERTPSVGELAARDRVCAVDCATEARAAAKAGEQDLTRLDARFRECLQACRDQFRHAPGVAAPVAEPLPREQLMPPR
ncbi:MAG: hypothetical protein H6704_18905 [Myxococcales bacterium]|nr:hypothetical protein [Myxococcales bacterium]